MHKQNYLVCYDIADPKRLQKVYRQCCKVGIPYQYSVFQLHCTAPEAHALWKLLAGIIDHDEDDVRAYHTGPTSSIVTLGETLEPDGIFCDTGRKSI